jgi:hypothetical protein
MLDRPFYNLSPCFPAAPLHLILDVSPPSFQIYALFRVFFLQHFKLNSFASPYPDLEISFPGAPRRGEL